MKTFRSFVTPLFDPVARQRFVVEMRAMFPLRGAPRPMVLSQALLGRFVQRSRKELTSGGGALTPTLRALRRGLQARFAKLGLGARASATATARTDDAGAAPCVTADDTPDDRCAAAGRSLLAHPGRRRDTVRRLAKAVHRSCGALCTPLRRGSSSRNSDGSDGVSSLPPDGPHPSATEGHTKNVRSASEAVQKAEESVARAEAEVLKLEVTCAAWECKTLNLPLKTTVEHVEHVLSMRNQVEASFKEMLRTRAQAIHDSVSTVEIAERKLENAKAELKEAERKLENAKAELKEAKEELEKAKAELKEAREKAKTELSIAELNPRVENALSSGQLRVASFCAEIIGKAQGMVDLAGELADTILIWAKNLLSLDHIDSLMQRTIAFVLRSSSGVGKTFFSLAAAKLLNKLLDGKVGTLYLGFNTGMPLRVNEETLLQEAPSYQSVERVLLRRLLIQLECLLAWKRKRSSPVPFTFDKYGLQHVVKMEGEFLASLPLLSEASLEGARKQALQLLTEVQKEYKLSHLMLVIDEGQKLDELIPPDSPTAPHKGGARYALRWTRQLQLDAFLGECGLVCFGLMTGINPETSLLPETDGTNHELSHMPMKPDDFRKLTKVVLDKASVRKGIPPATLEPLINIVSASVFPDARKLTDVGNSLDESGVVPLPVYDYEKVPGFDETLRRKLVVGALAGIPIDSTVWELKIPSDWTTDRKRFPCPSYAMLVGLLKGISSDLPRTTSSLAVKDCYEFEAFAAQALWLLLWVFKENFSRTTNHSRKDVMHGIFPAQKDHSSFRSIIMETFPEMVKGFWMKYPDDAKRMHYPSSIHGTHTKAFAVGEDSPALGGTFKECTDKLYDASDCNMNNNGNTLLFRCGGSAPIDFVILHKKSESVWQLTLADTKHKSKNSKKNSKKKSESESESESKSNSRSKSKSEPTSQEKTMAEKGDMVFQYLEQQLKTAERTKDGEKKEYGVTLTWDRTVLLITNATRGAPVKEVRLRSKKGKPPREPVTIVRLMPSTFKMGNVTEFLFTLPYAADEQQKEQKNINN